MKSQERPCAPKAKAIPRMGEVVARHQGIWARKEDSSEATVEGTEGYLADARKRAKRMGEGGAWRIRIFREMLYGRSYWAGIFFLTFVI